MSKQDSLSTLADLGARVPESHLVSADDARALSFLVERLSAHSGALYVRLIGAKPLGKVVAAADLLSFVGSAKFDEGQQLLVQALISFQMGGAIASFSDNSSYIEAVRGMPVGLLRHGELAYAERRDQSEHTARFGAQEREWVVSSDRVVARILHNRNFTELADMSDRALAERPQRSGLFEWGLFKGLIYWLDWHAASDYLERLREIVDSNLEPRRSSQSYDAKLPILRNSREGKSRLTFERGARLSHVVTYAARSGSTSIDFQGW